MSARHHIEFFVGRHNDRISALFPSYLRLAGAHPLELAKLVRSVREEFLAGRDDGDVGARELLELPGLRTEANCALEPRGP